MFAGEVEPTSRMLRPEVSEIRRMNSPNPLERLGKRSPGEGTARGSCDELLPRKNRRSELATELMLHMRPRYLPTSVVGVCPVVVCDAPPAPRFVCGFGLGLPAVSFQLPLLPCHNA